MCPMVNTDDLCDAHEVADLLGLSPSQQRVRLPAALRRHAPPGRQARARSRRCGCAPRSGSGLDRPPGRGRADEPAAQQRPVLVRQRRASSSAATATTPRSAAAGAARAWSARCARYPTGIARPRYVTRRRAPAGPAVVTSRRELPALRRAGRVAAEVLAEAGADVPPGVTTDELDEVAHEAYCGEAPTRARCTTRATPSRSARRSTRSSATASPTTDRCADGDIVNVDVTAYVDGMHGDTSATFAVGELDAPTRRSSTPPSRRRRPASPRSRRADRSAPSARRSSRSPTPAGSA